MISANTTPWLTITETAALLGITYQTSRKLINEKKLISKRNEENGRFLVLTKSVIEYIQQNKRKTNRQSAIQENGQPHPLMIYSEAATYLRVSVPFLRKLIVNEEIEKRKIGGKVFVTRISVTDYLKKVLAQ